MKEEVDCSLSVSPYTRFSNYREAESDRPAMFCVNKYVHPGGSHLIHQNAEDTSPDRGGAEQGPGGTPVESTAALSELR